MPISDEQWLKSIGARPVAESSATQAGIQPPVPTTPWSEVLKQAGAAGTQLFPAAGGIIGGMAGGPPGAFLGGGLGELLRSTTMQRSNMEPPMGLAANLTGAAGAGGEQAMLEGLGRLLGAGSRIAGENVMQGSLRPVKGVREAAQRTAERQASEAGMNAPSVDYKQLAKQAISEKIGPSARGGSGRMASELSQNKEEVGRLFNALDAKGARAKLSDIADQLKSLEPGFRADYGEAGVKKLNLMIKRTKESMLSNEISMSDLNRLKGRWQDLANYAKDKSATVSEFNKARAGIARKTLTDPATTGNLGQRIENLNARSSSISSLTDALKGAEGRAPAPFFKIPLNHQLRSELALLLANPATTGSLAQTPRGIAEALHMLGLPRLSEPMSRVGPSLLDLMRPQQFQNDQLK
jgi:hypothetical protein